MPLPHDEPHDVQLALNPLEDEEVESSQEKRERHGIGESGTQTFRGCQAAEDPLEQPPGMEKGVPTVEPEVSAEIEAEIGECQIHQDDAPRGRVPDEADEDELEGRQRTG